MNCRTLYTYSVITDDFTSSKSSPWKWNLIFNKSVCWRIADVSRCNVENKLNRLTDCSWKFKWIQIGFGGFSSRRNEIALLLIRTCTFHNTFRCLARAFVSVKPAAETVAQKRSAGSAHHMIPVCVCVSRWCVWENRSRRPLLFFVGIRSIQLAETIGVCCDNHVTNYKSAECKNKVFVWHSWYT